MKTTRQLLLDELQRIRGHADELSAVLQERAPESGAYLVMDRIYAACEELRLAQTLLRASYQEDERRLQRILAEI